jgi:hypothetical protein
MDLGILYVSLAAGAGAVVAGILGWLESGEAFSAKKYLPTILRAALAAILAAVATPIVAPIGWVVIISAFVAGAGIDVIGHRVAAAIRKG